MLPLTVRKMLRAAETFSTFKEPLVLSTSRFPELFAVFDRIDPLIVESRMSFFACTSNTSTFPLVLLILIC